MAEPLPPGVSADQMAETLEKFRRIVGKEWVFSGEQVASYHDPYPISNDDSRYKAHAAVAPTSLEQVQEIVKAANVSGVPLWPVSRGKNFAYGGAAPVLSGSVVLDMSRMNRILEVNEKFGYALVEPGVSYFDLYNHIQAKGLKLWLDVPDPGWGSVMGNALDHGVGYTPYGDHFMMQCGMEVVLASGEVVRTGMGAMPGNNTWQLFKYGFGPYVDGLFSQSNFGVVTKMGIWLMPEPPGYRPYLITFQREEDIEQGSTLRDDFSELLPRDGAKTVRRDANDVIVGLRSPHHRVEQLLERVDAVQEATLAGCGRSAIEIAVRVEDRQQRQAKTRRSRGADDAP